MEQTKFIVNRLQPLMLNIISEHSAILICLLHEDLQDRYLFSETIIDFIRPTRLAPGMKINLTGQGLKTVLSKKDKTNTVITYFKLYNDTKNNKQYYYNFKGSNYLGLNYVDILAPRNIYITIRYMIDVIQQNGGFPRSASFIFKHKKMKFIKVESLKLEGSKVIQYKDGNVSVVKNAFKLYNGPKEYTVVETLYVKDRIEDVDLLIPVPEFVFTSVYVDMTEAVRLKGDYGEMMFLIFNDEQDNESTTVFIINNEDDVYKLSSNYWIKKKGETKHD